jgi:hypothetical protein
MAQFFNVKVQFTVEDENGKLKKHSSNYLVDAMSVTEAEATITKHLTERSEQNFEVKAASESKIVEVVLEMAK